METVQVLRRHWLALGAVVVLALTAAVLLIHPGSRDDDTAGVAQHRIPGTGGAMLAAEVITPRAGSGAPLVVMPAGWAVPVSTYRVLAEHLAATGYEVIVYSQRGQVGSTATIDDAGPATVADVSRVIDWAAAHTRAATRRVGMWGTSYGAGVSLLAAARDPRIRAVVATSTWASLSDALTPNGTVATQTLSALFTGARLDAPLSAIRTALGTDPQSVVARFRALSPARSPLSVVSALNRSRPAIMLVNGFEDRYFSPRPLVGLYRALTTPKRLELLGGDHGGPGYAGILGQHDVTTDDGLAWLDHYLRGRANGVDSQAPIRLRDVTTGAWRSYRQWPTATAADVFDLLKPGPDSTGPDGIGTTPAAWSSSITTGVDTAATSGTAATYPPLRATLAGLSPLNAVSWTGPAVVAPTPITGSPDLHLDLGSSAPEVTFFVHVYDVGTDGGATLMNFTPVTVTGLRPGQTRGVDIGLQPIAWTLPAGDRVTVVLDTVDARYHSAAPAGTTLRLASNPGEPATLTVPVQ